MHTICGDKVWDGEDLEEDMACGLEEAPSAIYPHGRDQDGFSEEGHAGGYFHTFTCMVTHNISILVLSMGHPIFHQHSTIGGEFYGLS